VAWKIGIHHDVRAAMPDVDHALLAWALSRLASRPAYLDAILTAGTPRLDLEGNLCGTVTEEEAERLRAARRRHAQRLANRGAEQSRDVFDARHQDPGADDEERQVAGSAVRKYATSFKANAGASKGKPRDTGRASRTGYSNDDKDDDGAAALFSEDRYE